MKWSFRSLFKEVRSQDMNPGHAIPSPMEITSLGWGGTSQSWEKQEPHHCNIPTHQTESAVEYTFFSKGTQPTFCYSRIMSSLLVIQVLFQLPGHCTAGNGWTGRGWRRGSPISLFHFHMAVTQKYPVGEGWKPYSGLNMTCGFCDQW